MSNYFNFIMTLIILAFTTTTSAKQLYKGYILTLEGQKIEGVIKSNNVTMDQIKITFIKDDKTQVYKAKHLQGYGYKYFYKNSSNDTIAVWRHYRSKMAHSYAPKPFTSKLAFMEIIEEGEVIVYDYYAEVPKDITEPYKRFFYLERKGVSQLVEVSKNNFNQTTKNFFGNMPQLTNKIGKVNYQFRNTQKIAKTYNQARIKL